MIAAIFIKEEWWDKLFEIVKKNPDLRTIEQYQQYLSKDYAEEIAELYALGIVEYLDYNVGRKHYQTACKYLRRMIKLGAREKANEIIAFLRAEYSRRPALMEELDKVWY